MGINIKTIEKIGKLTKIHFSEEEKKEFAKDLESIDKLMSRIKEVNTENVEPLLFLNEDCVPLRDDKPEPSQAVSEILSNAPEMKDGQIVVPRIIKK